MRILISSPYGGANYEYDQDSVPSIEGWHISLGVDLSTKKTGITLGYVDGTIVYVMLFSREKDESIAEYKLHFKQALHTMLSKSTLYYVIQEERFSKGLYKVDESLSNIKTLFEDYRQENNLNYIVQYVPQQVWKSDFILTEDRSMSKDNVMRTVEYLYPNLHAEKDDMPDSVGLWHYYKNNIVPSIYGYNNNNELSILDFTQRNISEVFDRRIYSVTKAMKVEHKHSLQTRAIQLRYGENLVLNEFETNRALSHGIKAFETNNEDLQKMCRRLTSNSNSIWVCKYTGKWLPVLLYDNEIVYDSNKIIYLICYRENVTKKTTL